MSYGSPFVPTISSRRPAQPPVSSRRASPSRVWPISIGALAIAAGIWILMRRDESGGGSSADAPPAATGCPSSSGRADPRAGERAAPVKSQTPAHDMPAATAVVPTSVKSTAETLPQQDGWDTEVISEAIDQQQKTLTKLLLHPADLTTEALKKLASADVTCGPLRPSGQSEEFRDRLFVVTRGKSDSAATHSGLQALADQLKALVAPGGGSGELHAKFKTIRVEPRKDGVRTEAYFQIGGRTPSGSLQINATWECLWTANDTPLLKSVRVLDYEEITGLAKAGPMFADVTEAVLADNASFR